jgi:hypothetical protein
MLTHLETSIFQSFLSLLSQSSLKLQQTHTRWMEGWQVSPLETEGINWASAVLTMRVQITGQLTAMNYEFTHSCNSGSYMSQSGCSAGRYPNCSKLNEDSMLTPRQGNSHFDQYQAGSKIGTPRMTSSPYLTPLTSLTPCNFSSGGTWERVLISIRVISSENSFCFQNLRASLHSLFVGTFKIRQ